MRISDGRSDVCSSDHPEATGAGHATGAREGKSPRSFALSRGPELARLQASFGALLSGDRAALEQHYAVHAEGTRRKWKMTLTPKAEPLAEKLLDIALYGRGIELRGIATRPTGAAIQRNQRAGAARTAPPINRPHGPGALYPRRTMPSTPRARAASGR